MSKNPLWEGFKEIGRIILLAVVAYLLTDGVLSRVLLATGVKLTPEQVTLITGLLTTALKAVDKWLHEYGKSIQGNKNWDIANFVQKGLTRF